jgi:hypothetical protein
MREYIASIDKAQIIRKKENYKWCRVVNSLWNFITRRKDDNFMHRTSTVGGYIYVAQGWDLWTAEAASTYVMLRHELRHVHFFENYGTFFGLLLYLFFPLPLGLAYVRYCVEREAVIDEITAIFLLGGDYALRVEDYVRSLSGWKYFYAWPFKRSIRKWFHRELLRRNPDMVF